MNMITILHNHQIRLNKWLAGCLIIIMLPLLCACHDEGDFSNTPEGNFEALWTLMDHRYCFFKYKEIDWSEIHDRYRMRISPDMNEEELFKVLSELLAELKDGHVNLSSAFNTSRYWKWFQDYPQNYNERLVNQYYLAFDYQMTGGLKYKVLSNNIGYLYYGSFSSGFGETNLDYVLAAFSACDGMIIDIRDNGGGSLTYVDMLASRFINERILKGYISHKTGPGHNDFSTPYPIYLDPSSRIRYQKPVVLLTNRSCFSAANDFVSIMKSLPNVTTIGDMTGGGSGLPFSSELPNGWSVRFSASPMYNSAGEQTEFGIAPDIWQNSESPENQMQENKDLILERAFQFLKSEVRQ